MYFATCERNTALGFLKQLYPSRVIEDTAASWGPVLDWVAADIIRICDPNAHGGQVIPSKNWSEEKAPEILAKLKELHEEKGSVE